LFLVREVVIGLHLVSDSNKTRAMLGPDSLDCSTGDCEFCPM
jgi:hypothetical protein